MIVSCCWDNVDCELCYFTDEIYCRNSTLVAEVSAGVGLKCNSTYTTRSHLWHFTTSEVTAMLHLSNTQNLIITLIAVLTVTGYVNGKGQFSTPPLRNRRPSTDHQKLVTGIGDLYSCAKIGIHPSIWATGRICDI